MTPSVIDKATDRVLVLPTSYVSKDTGAALDAFVRKYRIPDAPIEPITDPLTVYYIIPWKDYGWVIAAEPQDDGLLANAAVHGHEALTEVLRWARRHDYDYVRFDCDAADPDIHELARFDW